MLSHLTWCGTGAMRLYLHNCRIFTRRWGSRSSVLSSKNFSSVVLTRYDNSITHQICKLRASRQLRKALADVPNLSRGYGISKPYTSSSDNRVLKRNIKHKDDADGEAVEITINNSLKLNSLDSNLMAALTDSIKTTNQSPSTRCIILRGGRDQTSNKTPAFSAGASLDEMSAIQTPQEAEAFITRISDLCHAITDSSVPIIAAIDGHCYGAGLEVAASCDVRYATAISTFAMPEVKVGIPSVVQARLLVDVMGWAHARHLILFGRTIDAEEAYRQGLINNVFENTKHLDKRVLEDVQSACEGGPIATKVQKELMREWQRLDVNGGIQAGVEAFKRMWEDGGKEPKAFMQKAMERLKSKKHKK